MTHSRRSVVVGVNNADRLRLWIDLRGDVPAGSCITDGASRPPTRADRFAAHHIAGRATVPWHTQPSRRPDTVAARSEVCAHPPEAAWPSARRPRCGWRAGATASPGGPGRWLGRPASCWSSAWRPASSPRSLRRRGWRRSSRRWPPRPGRLPLSGRGCPGAR